MAVVVPDANVPNAPVGPGTSVKVTVTFGTGLLFASVINTTRGRANGALIVPSWLLPLTIVIFAGLPMTICCRLFVLPLKSDEGSGMNVATIVCGGPADNVFVVQAAVPFETVAVQSTVPPSENWTVPRGTGFPELSTTFAVNVTFVPSGTPDGISEVTVVVVALGTTTKYSV